MDRLDYQEVKKHINILNVAYHLCLEIVDEKGYEHKAICPFCGYNSQINKYCCSRCRCWRIFSWFICKSKRYRYKKSI